MVEPWNYYEKLLMDEGTKGAFDFIGWYTYSIVGYWAAESCDYVMKLEISSITVN